MAIQFSSLSTFRSDPVDVELSEIDLTQSQVLFNGGYVFNFVDALSSCIDVKSKNYSNFYLTKKTLLEDVTTNDTLFLTPQSFLTPISFGQMRGEFLTLSAVPMSSRSPTSYGYYYTGKFVQSTKQDANYFKLELYNDLYCKISYQTLNSKSYLVLDNENKAIFKQALLYDTTFSSTSDVYFRYILNDNKLVLLKNISNVPHQLTFMGGFLSAVNVSVNPFSRIPDYALTISNNIVVRQEVSSNTSYINYTPGTLDINVEGSIFSLENNYLLYRNLNVDTLNKFKVIVLKNQMSDNGVLAKSNNLALSGREGKVLDNREYTSINNDIDALEDQTLSLNYGFNNKLIPIAPGRNYFKTEKSMFPFSQININDTTFINTGAFSSISPVYADRVIAVEVFPSLNTYEYLCTWLSGSPLSNEKVWVDRYYAPDSSTRDAALAGNSIYNDTYDSFVDQLIVSNPISQASIEEAQYIDKKSDFVFKPNSEYIYERVDLENLEFVQSKSDITKSPNYYQSINDNNGFCFGCNILNYDNDDIRKIYSKRNRKDAGLNISYSSSFIEVIYSVYNISTRRVETVGTGIVKTLQATSNNIVFSANHKTGRIVCYINGIILFERYIKPLYYLPLFGDIVVEDQNIYKSQDAISELTLTTQPLNDEEVSLLVSRYNDSQSIFNISLPCGQRNKNDYISHISSLQTNLKSKANAVNIYINNLNIDDEELQDSIKYSISSAIEDVLPMNVKMNNLEILS